MGRSTTSDGPARIAVFASGGGSNLEALFERFAGGGPAAVRLVVADTPRAGALDRARARGVPTAIIDPAAADEIIRLLDEHRIDWVVLAGYLKRVPEAVVDAYQNRILNIHPALLPAYGGKGMYGHHVHEAVVAAGEAWSGASVHLVDEAYDRGPVVEQRRVPVLPGDTASELAARVLEVEHELLPDVVEAVAEGRLRTDGKRAWIEADMATATGNEGDEMSEGSAL